MMNINSQSASPSAGLPGFHILLAVLTDRVFLAFCLVLAALAVVDADQARAGLWFALNAFAGILPFLLVAVSLAAVSRATGADRRLAAAFSGSPRRAVLVAALAGALSPFCSCGVVPLIAALLGAGVPLAPVMAFWIASPVMDPEMFVLTAAGIGLEFAVAKTVAAVVMGLLAGFGVHVLRGSANFTRPLLAISSGCSASLATEPVIWRFWRSPERLGKFRAEVVATALFLGKWLLLAFLLESLMTAYVPPAWIAQFLGGGAWYEVPLAAVIGIPAYLNGYAAIPLVAGLLDMGMNPGAALAFMTAGAVSSIPAAMAVAVLVKRSVFATYLILGLCGSLLAGLLYGAIV